MKPKTYLLLHGAWHASWCWNSIVPLLTAKGHKALAPDLPGHGCDQTPLEKINLATYVDFISTLVQQQDKPVTLVGHSMAGIIISQVAENMPEKVVQLIYVTAFIPDNNGFLIQEAKKSTLTGLSNQMHIDTAKNKICLTVSEQLKRLFYNKCNDSDAEAALSRLQPEPFKPFVEPIIISEKKFGSIDKLYIACQEDKIISLEDQQRMYKKNSCHVAALNADHSPFLSAPRQLAKALLMR